MMTFSTTIDLALADKLLKDLKEQGFEITKPQYTLFSGKKPGVVCTLYQSGKLTVQGKNKNEFIEFYLEPHIIQDFALPDETPRIGSDESGKGDFFGPLCVAAVYAGEKQISRLKDLGVRDSKKMTDPAIIKMAREIEKHFVHHIVVINPAKYNELYKSFANLNNLLAWGHATAIVNLVDETGCEKVIVDQFAAEFVMQRAIEKKHPKIQLIQRHRGEEDLVVAAGAILARKTFVFGLEKLGSQYKTVFPKGGGSKTVQAGKDFVRTYGPEELAKVCKLHFKNRDAILNSR